MDEDPKKDKYHDNETHTRNANTSERRQLPSSSSSTTTIPTTSVSAGGTIMAAQHRADDNVPNAETGTCEHPAIPVADRPRNERNNDHDEMFTRTGKRKKKSERKYLSTREMVTGVRKGTSNTPIQHPVGLQRQLGDFRIFRPSPYDVLCGRGKPIQDHSGNIRMRTIVAKYTDYYANSKIHKKQEIVEAVVKLIKHFEGIRARFLKRVGRENYWMEVSDEVACDKISHAFRCIVRKGEPPGPQEKLEFRTSSDHYQPQVSSKPAAATTATNTTNDDLPRRQYDSQATAQNIGSATKNDGSATKMMGDNAWTSRDLLLGLRSSSTPLTSIDDVKISSAPSAAGAVGTRADTQSNQRLQGIAAMGSGGLAHENSLVPLPNRNLLGPQTPTLSTHPFLHHTQPASLALAARLSAIGTSSSVPVARDSSLPLPGEISVLLDGGTMNTSSSQPTTAAIAAYATNRERLIDLLARERVQRELSEMQQQKIQKQQLRQHLASIVMGGTAVQHNPFRVASATEASNSEMERMRALEALMKQKADKKKPPPKP